MTMNNICDIQSIAHQALELEMQTIAHLIPTLNDEFTNIVHLIGRNTGKVVVTGVGKSAIIGQKIVATLNSTGTTACFLHAADAIHGDLGIIEENDIVLCLSKSGQTPEIKIILNIIKAFGNKIIGMSAVKNSHLHTNSDFFIWTPIDREADQHNLAPTCSTIAQLAMGDALAISVSQLKGFQEKDFAKYHPGGMLGKSLHMEVAHLIHLHEKPAVQPHESIDQVILEMTAKRLGATAVIDHEDHIAGIITDGDLRRMLLDQPFQTTTTAKDIMTTDPITIAINSRAVAAIEKMQKHSITQLIVTNKNRYAGMIHLHDLLNEGFQIPPP
ncbi:KpsF/GutQ family sugar-phosphate isomerase [Membranicola marinus]|uniref:KpsF/GutQ family sugar-phosphate isomerase n=2 Tax=Membranihabitans marinus TaxID=1227546 RepID=A0A953LA25_9BACT|nr:KpsF/GutQ family sugar-phosphate isomerase [Membranihabitans marinus]